MRRLAIVLLWFLWRLLPARALGALGGLLGGLMYYLGSERRHVVTTNLRLCFPQRTEAERARLARAHFRAVGRAALQETASWWGSQEEIMAMAQVEGREHLAAYLGKPVILYAPHFVGVSIGGIRLSAEFAPLVTLNARIKNPHIHRLVFRARHRFAGNLAYERGDGIKPVLRAIKKGLPFYYPPDLDFGRKDAIFVPFFGVPAATITGLARVARMTRAAVVPAITRQEGGGYVTRLYPAWENFPTDDVEADTRRVNAFLEERIREMPAQYFWVHKRFKTRPEGEASFYGTR